MSKPAEFGKRSKLSGLEVRYKDSEPVEKMIRRFVRAVRTDGVLRELFDRRGYEKPSVKRRRKRTRAEFARCSVEK